LHPPSCFGIAHLLGLPVQEFGRKTLFQTLLPADDGGQFLVGRLVIIASVNTSLFAARTRLDLGEAARPMIIQIRVEVRCVEFLKGRGVLGADRSVADGEFPVSVRDAG
jgi:hypothetical protein